MASLFKVLSHRGNGAEHLEEFKQTGVDPNGQPVYAQVFALEPASIGGGGGGVAGSVTIADGTTSTQKLAVSASGAASTDVIDRAGRLLGHVTVDNASLAVTGPLTDTQLRASAVPVDTTDRVARLLGHVTVDNASLAVTGPLTDTQLRASAVTVDVNDRVARLLGHVTVDNATLAVTQSGAWNVGITTSPVPVSDNAGSLTVDAPVGTPVFVRNSDGAAAIDPRMVLDSAGTNLAAVVNTADADVARIGLVSDARLKVFNGTSWDRVRGDATNGLRVQQPPTQFATTISAANAAVTLTLAAPGAGLFHYITSVEIVNINPTATAIAGSAVTLAYTTTNLPGSPAWTAGNALAAGAEKVVARLAFEQPIKASVANTATTIVAPAIGAGGLCRIQVTFYTGP